MMNIQDTELVREIAVWGGSNAAVHDLMQIDRRKLRQWCAKHRIQLRSSRAKWSDDRWLVRLQQPALVAEAGLVIEIYHRLRGYDNPKRIIRSIALYQKQHARPALSWDAAYAAIKLHLSGVTRIERCVQCTVLFRALYREHRCPICVATLNHKSQCGICGDVIPKPKGRGRPRKYCSKKCSEIARLRCITASKRHNGVAEGKIESKSCSDVSKQPLRSVSKTLHVVSGLRKIICYS